MELWTDIIDPADITDFSREVVSAYDADPGTLSQVFPTVTTTGNTFSWAVNGKAQDVAQYRAFDAESAIGTSAEVEELTAKLAPVSLKKELSEYDQIVRQSANSPETVQAAADRLASEVAKSVIDRVVRSRGEALVTGKLAIKENRFIQNVDFERRPDFTTTAGTLWDADGDPIADLEQWRDAFVLENGVEPTLLYGSTKIRAALARSVALRGYLGSTAPTVIGADQINAILQSYGLPSLTVVTARVAGQPVMDQSHVVLAAAGAGGTIWGSTAEALDPDYGLAYAAQSGLVVGAYKSNDPNVKWIRATGTVLPILADSNRTFAAKVVA